MRFTVSAAAVLLAFASLPVLALPDPDDGWSGTGELGVAISKGNTDSQTVVAKMALAKEDVLWKHAARAAFLHGENDDVETARRYELYGSSGRRLGARSRVFGSARNERDRFAATEYQWTVSVGYGLEAIDSDTTQLTFEIGPGYRWSKAQGVRDHDNGGIVRGGMEFRHQLTATTTLYDTLLVEAGDENTFIRNELGLQVSMTDALALKAGFELRHNTERSEDTRRTDTLTTVNIVYGF